MARSFQWLLWWNLLRKMLAPRRLATLATEFPGHAVIDSGAIDSIASLEALQHIMDVRVRKHGHEQVQVHPEQKRLNFPNLPKDKPLLWVCAC